MNATPRFAGSRIHSVFSPKPFTAAKVNTERGKNGIIHAMNNRDKSALSLALAIVGGIAAGMRCDASEWVDNSPQYAIGSAAFEISQNRQLWQIDS